MTTRKTAKKSISLLAVLACFLVALSFSTAVVKVGAVEPMVLTYYYSENEQMVKESGIDPHNHFEGLYKASSGNEDFAHQKMKFIVEMAAERLAVLACSDAFIDQMIFGYEQKKAIKQCRDEILDLLTITDEFAILNETEFEGYVAHFTERYEELALRLAELCIEEVRTIFEEIDSVLEKIYKKHEALTAESRQGGVLQTESYSIYISSQLNAIDGVRAKYVSKDGEDEYVAGPKLGEFIVKVQEEYETSKHQEFLKELEAIEDQAITELESIPKNDMEIAWAAFNDLLNTPETQATYDKLLNSTVKKAQTAVSVYDKSSQAVKDYYKAEYKVLSAFLETPEDVIAAEMTSSYTVSAISISAVYEDDMKPARVLPKNLTLKVYPSYNGSAARNASKLIKESDEELAVSYIMFVRFYTDYGKPYELPTVEKSTGKKVTYKIEIDLNKYYDVYLKGESYYSNENKNILDAHERITDEKYEAKTSLCYGYSNGEINALDYELKEGGKIVFYTNTLNNFCFAGIDTSTLFSNPLFYVAVVVGLILLIIIIKAIVKHARYTIKFYSNGGSKVKRVKAAKNEYFVMPASPVKQNFVFAGWYTDKELTKKFIGIRMMRRRKIKLYAKWAAPATQERLQQFYDILRKTMASYQKVSFKPTLGLVEKEHLASIFREDINLTLYLAIDPEKAKAAGFTVTAHKDKKFVNLPSKLVVSTETSFAEALKLIKDLFTSKGLQVREGAEADEIADGSNNENGFAYFITNERVASTPADFFELLRLALKGYVLEKDPGVFKEGDKFTFARIYATATETKLYLPTPHGKKPARVRNPRFSDTPNEITIRSASDILEAYDAIEQVMLSYSFTKYPENSNDIQDVDVPDGNGFAYTIKF